MGAALLLAMRGIGMRLITSFASKKLLEWLLFWALDMIVKSSKTEADNELLVQVKNAYYGVDSDGKSTD